MKFGNGIASTGSALAYLFDTSNVLTNGDTILSVQNSGSDRFTGDALGNFTASQTFFSGLNSQSRYGIPGDVLVAVNDTTLGEPQLAEIYLETYGAGNDDGIFAVTVQTNRTILSVYSRTVSPSSDVTLTAGNANDGGSNSSSIGLRHNNADVFHVDYTGAVSIGSLTNTLLSSGSSFIYTNSDTTVDFKIQNGSSIASFGLATTNSNAINLGIGSARVGTFFGTTLQLPVSGALGFSTTSDTYNGGTSTRIINEGLGILALQNATTAQNFRIYSSTNVSTGDYARMSIAPTASQNVFNSEAGGAGTFNPYVFNIGATNKFNVAVGGISTAAPGVGSTAAWRLGDIQTGLTLAMNLTNAINVTIGGVNYKLALAQ
jgi:hypothetical protein